jgi:catechol-2,3-dioxygenase
MECDAAVDFQRSVFGLVETDRVAGTSCLTCNDRHHELMLIADPSRRGYDHIALEVADRAALEAAPARVSAAGGRVLGEIRHLRGMERFLRDGLGFRFSDRMAPLASWWHCDADHHGMAITWGPRPELSHDAYAWEDFAALGRVADRLREHRDRRCVWGPSRHGPGNNHFLYLLDEDGAMAESYSELAQMPPSGDCVARKWPWGPGTINQWGGPPPLAFLQAGYPIAGHGS